MQPLWLNNLKKWTTGTANSSKQCLDVHVANTVTTAIGQYAFKERRVHLPATTTIPASASAMIEIDLLSGTTGGTAVANTITEIGINWNGDGIIEFGVGADAAAAAAATKIATVGAGQTRAFGVSLVSTNKIWIRAVKNATITAGELVVVLLG